MQALFGALWTDCQSDYARILEVLLKIFQISNIMRSNNRLIEIPEGFAPLSRFDDLQARFGHVFANRELLLNACIRQSALNESLVSAKSSFQTLEFLGDKVLGCIVAGWLIANCKEVGSDVLTPVFNELVGNLQILPDVAIDIRLGDALIVGAGEEKVQVRLNRRRLADHMEALIAALWLDVFPDYEKTARTVIELFNAKIKSFLSKKYCTKEQILFDHTEFPSLPAPASSVDKEEAVDSGGNLSETYASIVSKSSPPRKRQVLWSTWSGTSNTSSGAPRTQQSSTKFKAPYLDDPEEFPPLGAIRRR
jgi:dsRNA-specific ribonuclease